VRAERVRLLGPDQGSDVRFPARITEIVFEGDRFVHEVRVAALGGRSLRLFDLDPLGHPRHEVGDTVTVGWMAQDLLLFSG
jgi:putative spermidine/putrescine transport system ATP-binding protein